MESSSSSESGSLLNVKNDQGSLVPETEAQSGSYGKKLNARSEALVLEEDKNMTTLAEIIQRRKLQSLKKSESNSNKKPVHIPNDNPPSVQLVADALSKAAEDNVEGRKRSRSTAGILVADALSKAAEDNLNERKRPRSTAGVLAGETVGVQKTDRLFFKRFMRVPFFSLYPARFRTTSYICELGKDMVVEASIPVHKHLGDPNHNQLQQATVRVVEQATAQTITPDPHHVSPTNSEAADQFVADYFVETEEED